MSFFGNDEEVKEGTPEVVMPKNWIKIEYVDIFNPMHKIVRNWASGVTVSDMIAEIDRAKKSTKSRKKEEIYYAMLASLYKMIYTQRGDSTFVDEDDLDQRKKAIFSFIFQIVAEVDIKNTQLSSLVLRMCMDFMEFYKNIIEEYDNRIFKKDKDKHFFRKLTNAIEQKYSGLKQRSDIENQLEQQAQIIKSTS